MVEDLDALDEIAEFIDKHTETGRRYEFSQMLDELRKSLMRELDYRQEANNLTTSASNCGVRTHHRSRAHLGLQHLARPDDGLRSRQEDHRAQPARPDGIRWEALAEELFRAYLEQILVDGFFHADPHPGNVFLTDDYRIALIDLGMVGRVMPGMQEQLLQLLLAIAEGRGDEAADIAIKIGDRREDFKEKEFTRRIAEIVAQQPGATVEQMQVGRIVLEVKQISAESGIRCRPN